jgi:aspartyl-tRNA(Asn)/glutamyl-tRNA(Gln) amidotransferase subunit B
MNLVPVIGLEIHVQLKTRSKMFCGCDNRGENAPPNTTICPVCLGFPGTLPVINKQAVAFASMVAQGLGAEFAGFSKFDRKNYFYPDLAKGYQISQYDLPVVKGGVLRASVKDSSAADGSGKREFAVRITRAHLEEDAAKLTHVGDGSSLVDYNRAGTPLLETVTEPDMKSPEEARAFLEEFRLLMRYLGVSDADMEKGHLRCDANISLKDGPDGELHAKTEIKNINSFKSVERALDYEIKRQTKLWLDGEIPSVSSTRGWDDDRGITVLQRTKEEANDYRYFPEPDLPPLHPAELAARLGLVLPELPEARRRRFVAEFGFSAIDADALVDDKEFADFTERVASELDSWLRQHSIVFASDEERRAAFGRLLSGWLLTKLRGVFSDRHLSLADSKASEENIAELIAMVHTGKVTGANAVIILDEMVVNGGDPSDICQARNLGQIEDASEIEAAAGNVIAANEKVVADYRGGKLNAIQFLVGQVMKLTRGKASPELAREILEKLLK